MSGRGLLILALLAAVAVGGLVLVRGPGGRAPSSAEPPLFLPGLEQQLEAVERVVVRAPDGGALAELVRSEGGWVVGNRWNHPADLETLRGTLIGLARARRLEPKTDRAEGHARLGVAAPGSGAGAGLEVRLEGTEPPVAVLIGEPATGDVGGTYVRRVGVDRAWLVSGNLRRHDRIDDWLDDRLLDIPPRRVHRVRIDPVDGAPVRVVLSSPQASGFELLGIPEGRKPLSDSIAQSIARVVTELGLDDVVPASAAGLPPLLAKSRFETFDGLVIEVEALAAARKDPPRRLVRLRAGTLDDAAEPVRAEARRLNERFDGWLYRLPDYKFVNLSYTLEQVSEPTQPAR